LETVYYEGTEEQWNAINIGGANGNLLNANIIYNYTGDDIKEYAEESTEKIDDRFLGFKAISENTASVFLTSMGESYATSIVIPRSCTIDR
jgi:hypothetical protein